MLLSVIILNLFAFYSVLYLPIRAHGSKSRNPSNVVNSVHDPDIDGIFPRVIVASPKSSGDNLFRKLFELATGLAKETALVKTHFPFLGSTSTFESTTLSSEFSVSSIIMILRHPLDIFLTPSYGVCRPGSEYPTFLNAWINSCNYWQNVTLSNDSYIQILRFEDLCADPIFEIRRVVTNLGIQIFDLDELQETFVSIARDFCITRRTQSSCPKPGKLMLGKEQQRALKSLGYGVDRAKTNILPLETQMCRGALDVNMSWFHRHGVPRTFEDTIHTQTGPIKHHSNLLRINSSDASVVYVDVPKSASTLVRETFPTFLPWSITPYEDDYGPAFSLVRHPISRLISAYGTINARCIADILSLHPNMSQSSVTDFLRYVRDSELYGTQQVSSMYNSTHGNIHDHLVALHLPFFRIGSEPARFHQFVRDIKNYGVFNWHLHSQTYQLLSTAKSGEPIQIEGIIHLENLAEDTLSLLKSLSFAASHTLLQLLWQDHKSFSRKLASKKSSNNIDELYHTLSESELGKKLLLQVFRYDKSRKFLSMDVIESACAALVETMYKQDYDCFGYSRRVTAPSLFRVSNLSSSHHRSRLSIVSPSKKSWERCETCVEEFGTAVTTCTASNNGTLEIVPRYSAGTENTCVDACATCGDCEACGVVADVFHAQIPGNSNYLLLSLTDTRAKRFLAKVGINRVKEGDHLSNLRSVRKLVSFCGFSDIFPEEWRGPLRSRVRVVNTTTTYEDLKNEYVATNIIFSEYFEGSQLSLFAEDPKLTLNSTQVVMATVSDFLLAYSNRAGNNVLRLLNGNLKLIDNQDRVLGKDVDSAFIPGTNKYLRHMDYRCHASGHSIGHNIPSSVRTCLATLNSSSASDIQMMFNLNNIESALLLRKRASYLNLFGFEDALVKYAPHIQPSPLRCETY